MHTPAHTAVLRLFRSLYPPSCSHNPLLLPTQPRRIHTLPILSPFPIPLDPPTIPTTIPTYPNPLRRCRKRRREQKGVVIVCKSGRGMAEAEAGGEVEEAVEGQGEERAGKWWWHCSFRTGWGVGMGRGGEGRGERE